MGVTAKPKYSRNKNMNTHTTNFWKKSFLQSRDNLDKSMVQINVDQVEKLHESD